MSGYWFKPKRYGYGATPTTWQGWAVSAAGAAVIIVATIVMTSMKNPNSPSVWLSYVLVVGSAVVWLVIVSYRKTEGEWRWRWGNE
jgi:peptidoglycan biosynthesis protein MviN/MurJ (putative lipid II flippase)